MKIQFNKQVAKEKGDQGLNRAVAAAENIHPDWAERAYKFFKKWLSRKPKGYRFLIEDFRKRVQVSKALPEPGSRRAYGGIPRRAANDGLIRKKGLRATRSITSHSCFATEWGKV